MRIASCALRAPKLPDAFADMGEHRFRYALFPHENGPQLGGVIPEAAAFNQPLRVSSTPADAQSESFFQVDNPAVVLDTVKKAEDSGDLIVRLYESHGAHQTATLAVSHPLKKAIKVDARNGREAPAHRQKQNKTLAPPLRGAHPQTHAGQIASRAGLKSSLSRTESKIKKPRQTPARSG
jgi:alpha-mannosidase